VLFGLAQGDVAIYKQQTLYMITI